MQKYSNILGQNNIYAESRQDAWEEVRQLATGALFTLPPEKLARYSWYQGLSEVF